jgi:poly(3-hydroxybutyrate) depolymerase
LVSKNEPRWCAGSVEEAMSKQVCGKAAMVILASAAWACSTNQPAMGSSLGNNAIGTGGTSAAAPATGMGGTGTGGAAVASGTGGGAATNKAPAGTGGAGTGAPAAGGSGGAASGTGGVAAPTAMGTGGGTGGATSTTPDETCSMTLPSSKDCSAKLAPGDRRSCMLGMRQYELYAGKTLNLCKPTALVIDAHGATETAVQQAGEMEFCAGTLCWKGLGSGWKAEADTPGGGFIVVFPQGVNNVWDTTDADFMVQLVAEVQKVANIDPKKVYISGISNGGALTYWAGCPHSDLFHGMAPHAGGANCTSLARPIPVIHFDDMPDFAYQGSVDATNTVVMLNHCKGDPKPWLTIDKMYKEAVCRSAKEDVAAKLIPCTEVTAMIEPTTCKVWDQCDGNVQVVFCEVAANTEHGASNASTDGHIIYENNTLLNTPSVAWRFFKQFW